MKNQHIIPFSLLILILLSGCGVYRYHHPTPNPALFHNEWEVQASGDLGTSGASVKGAVSLPKNIAVTGMASRFSYEYWVREQEVSVGYYSPCNPSGVFISAGYGWGRNRGYEDGNNNTLNYEGEFKRPFIQANIGADGASIAGPLKIDLMTAVRASWFMYDGIRYSGSGGPLKSRHLLIEPTFMVGVGTRNVRADLSLAMPFHPTLYGLDDRYEARTYPSTVSVWLRFIINRKKEETVSGL